MRIVRRGPRPGWIAAVALVLGFAAAQTLAASPPTGGPLAVGVADDTGKSVALPAPARRIVSLAPHATEILFAVGAGDQVVGVVAFSDYPPRARDIPQVGNADALDLERIRALMPDLVVAWGSGNGPAQVGKLRAMGIPVYVNEPATIADIFTTMEHLGILAGRPAEAVQAAGVLREQYTGLVARYARERPVSMFYQVWDHPLMTINRRQVISDAMRTCGAVNVFADLPALVPVVDVEAVLAADPEIIATSGEGDRQVERLDQWKRWPRLRAVRHGNLVLLPPDLLSRMGPRMIHGMEVLCDAVAAVRREARP